MKRVLRFVLGSTERLSQTALKNILIPIGCANVNWGGPVVVMDMSTIRDYKKFRESLK